MIAGKGLLETSKAILLFKVAHKKYCLLEGWFDELYKDSMVYKKPRLVFSVITASFRYSFLGRITEISDEDNSKEILENSGFAQWLLKICAGGKKRIMSYLKTSFTANCAAGLKNELYVLPVKTISLIVVTAILSDAAFYALLKNVIQREIGLLGWIIRGMLLSAGLAGLLGKADLENLASASLFFKWINRCK